MRRISFVVVGASVSGRPPTEPYVQDAAYYVARRIKAHARICADSGQRGSSLPRQLSGRGLWTITGLS